VVKGMLLSWRNTKNLIPTRKGALLKASYFSMALVFTTIAFEIKVQTLLCIFLFPVLLIVIWFEYFMSLPYRQ